MALESIDLEHVPASHTLHIGLFRNVKNASFLHQQLLAGNTDFEYAFVDASVVSASPPFYPSLPATDLLGLGLISPPPSTAALPVFSKHVTDTTNIIQVVSRLHALAAAYRAVNDLLENRLRSRNVHSEIVFSFSPNNNVSHPRTALALS